MRRSIKIIFLIMICSFLCANKVKAELTNYSDGTIFKNNRECTGNYCIVGNNTNYIIIQARLNYLNISNFENIGKTYYFVNTNAYNYLKSYDLNLIEISQFNSYSGENRYQNAVDYLTNNYLNNETNGKEMLNKLTGFNDYTSVLIKDIKRNSGSTQGYRILLEPSLVISNVKNGNNTALLTGKGIASLDSTKLSSKLGTYYNQMIKIFDSNTADSNLSLFNGSEDKCKGYNNQTLSDYKVKCLYKMYNVDDYINKDGNYTCYKKTIEVKNGGIKCANWDKNNEEEYTEKYTQVNNCNSYEDRKNMNIYGKSQVFNDIGSCRLHCKEKLELSFPGNISIPKQKGTYFAWPTTTDGSQYKMQIKTTMDCNIVDDGGTTTQAATMTRECDKNKGWYNNPDNPNECISKINKKSKQCPSDTVEVTIDGRIQCRVFTNPTVNPRTYLSEPAKCDTANGFELSGLSGDKACVKYDYQGKSCLGTNYVSADRFILSNGSCIASTFPKCPTDDYTQDSNNGNCVKIVSKDCGSKSERNGKCYDVSAALTTKWISQVTCDGGELQADNYCHSTPTTVHDCSASGGSYDGNYCVKNRPNRKQCSSLGKGWTSYGSNQCKHTAGSKRDCISPWQHYKGGGNITIECIKPPSYSNVQINVSPYCNSGVLHGSECWSNESTKSCHNSMDILGTCYVFSNPDPNQCPTGYMSQNGSCFAYSNYDCKSGYDKTNLSGNKACRKFIKYSKKICPGKYELVGDECRLKITPDCPGQSGGTKTINNKCCQNNTTANYQYNTCITTETKFKECSKGYYDTKPNSNDGECLLISTKPNATSNCPEGYIKNGNTCINPCTSEVKEKYLSRMKEKLKNPKFEAYLKVNDSDRKINDKLEIYNIGTVKEINISRNNNELKEFKLEVTYNVKMNENINRFYNKLTDEVSDINKAGYYDRGEGVISLKRTIKTFGLNNTINNYRLEINNFKNVGTDTTFDNLLNSNAYVCQYRITDKSNCKCPIGTKNEGNSVYNISAYINEKNPKIESSNTDVTNSCVELQEQYCNYEIEQEYCKKDDGEKVDITDCIKNKNTTYEEAYNICEKEKCNPSNNYCTKNCTYIDKKINNTVYTIQKCNNNTEICGFYLHCIDEKETSQSYLDLVSQRLNTTNIVKSLRDGLNIDNIESAIRGLDSSICGIKRQPKVVYREIDLNNPFPGKDGKNREAGYNWKSETIINKKITNNRGVKTNQIYNKEPIYTITLTPQIINKIRDYNENNKYNTLLKCNGSVCISDFIHGNSYSLKSMGILSGISNCTNLNTSSTLSSFDSCYNSNN